jgi:hypothetical protein
MHILRGLRHRSRVYQSTHPHAEMHIDGRVGQQILVCFLSDGREICIFPELTS